MRNYLRVRGEYCPRFGHGTLLWELPPRARRIRYGDTGPLLALRTTSACAENTGENATERLAERNYLRVRGEYGKPISRGEVSMELPPRARRIQFGPFAGRDHMGTTSACAENTKLSYSDMGEIRNYLRVRGEYPK